eukprot:m.99559 g.99559  ORF g.99559 m.99559 type:complete len:738 (-) comp14910_c1_seq1:20-2233(-)
MNASERSLVFEGWGWKQGKMNKAFRRRFFRLYDDGYVAYYASLDALKPKGFFSLTAESTVITPNPSSHQLSATASLEESTELTGSKDSNTVTATLSRKSSTISEGEGYHHQQPSWPKSGPAEARLSIVTSKRTFHLQLDTVGKCNDFKTSLTSIIEGLQPLDGDFDSSGDESESDDTPIHKRHGKTQKKSSAVAIEDTHEYVDELSEMGQEETSAFLKEFFERPYHKVIIIGAGLAGLTAAQHLKEAHGIIDVLVLEAGPRIGGRIRPMQIATLPKVYLDAGACQLYGMHQNAMFGLVEAHGCDTYEMADYNHDDLDVGLTLNAVPVEEKVLANSAAIYSSVMEEIVDEIEEAHTAYEDKQVPLPRDRNVAARLARGLRNHVASSQRDLASQDTLAYYRSRAEAKFGQDFSHLSLNSFLERQNLPGGDLLVRDTARAVHKLAADTHVRLNQPVTHIEEVLETIGVNGKEITAHMKVKNRQGRAYLCDFVLVTVPVSQLKDRAITFEPPLPEPKLQAIDRIGFGVINKIFLHFRRAFWDADDAPESLRNKEVIAEIQDFANPFKSGPSAEVVPLHYLNYHKMFGIPVLVGIVAGEHAATMEALHDSDLTDLLAQELRQMFPNASEADATPLSCQMTRWARHPHIRGAVSYLPVNATGDDMDEYGRPAPSKSGANPRLFFAGEATERDFYGTMHGAIASAKKQVNRMVASMLHTSINVTGMTKNVEGLRLAGRPSATDI